MIEGKGDGKEPGGARGSHEGTAASPGFGIGPAYVVGRRRVHVPHNAIEREQMLTEGIDPADLEVALRVIDQMIVQAERLVDEDGEAGD